MKLLKLFLKFSLVGLSGVVVNLSIYSGLVFFEVNYLVAATISFLGAVTNNFYWNFIWTFKDQAEHKTVSRKYFDFLVISGVNFVVNIFLLRLMYETLEFNKIIAQILAIGITSTLNFIGNYLITFREQETREGGN